MNFGKEDGVKLGPKWDQELILSWKAWKTENYCKTIINWQIFRVSVVQVGSWEPKSIKNRSQNEVTIGRHLDIDFLSILEDLGSQVGAMLAPESIPNAVNSKIIFWTFPKMDYVIWRGVSSAKPPPQAHHKWCPLDSRTGFQYPKGTVNRDWELVLRFWHALGQWPGEFCLWTCPG